MYKYFVYKSNYKENNVNKTKLYITKKINNNNNPFIHKQIKN